MRFPDGFDEAGCALIARGGADPQRVCPAVRATTPSVGTAADWARYLGYEGPPTEEAARAGGVVILPGTLTFAARGWWQATGLVHNGSAAVAREVRVTVTLAAAEDRLLGSTTVVVPVRNVRPGEPAPFEVRTIVPVQSVRRVTWSVVASIGGGTSPPSRMAEIELGRIAASPSLAEERPEARTAAQAGAPDGGAARIGWGILRNWGPLPISRATVVGMWIDERGRAVRLVEGRVAPSMNGVTAIRPELLPGGTQSFELFEREPSAQHADRWRLALWQSTW